MDENTNLEIIVGTYEEILLAYRVTVVGEVRLFLSICDVSIIDFFSFLVEETHFSIIEIAI